jgi:hypothetical protein
MEHPIIIDIIILAFGFYIGVQFTSLFIKYSLDKEKKKYKEKLESIFKEVSDNVTSRKTKFLYRINNTVRFETTTKSLGLITVYFYINKTEVLIFKDDEALYTSKELDSSIVSELGYLLKISFSNEIHDTVNVFGTVYSRKYFIDTFKVSLEDMEYYEESESKTVEENYDVDTILDKINLVGYEKLSVNEKEFLKKYSNGQY